MQTTASETEIITKTRELCQTILDQPEFKAFRKDVDAFLGDEKAQSQYQALAARGEQLQQKQQTGIPLDGAEIAEFEAQRQSLFDNPVARAFLEAQQQMQRVQDSIGQHVAKTFELGRVPEDDDFSSGSCGSSCGCH